MRFERLIGLGLGLGVWGCGIYSLPTVETFAGASPRGALVRARDGNWRVRATLAGGAADGRVSFVSDSMAKIGERRVRFADIAALERWTATDNGGKVVGAGVGALLGIGLGALSTSWYQFGAERQCTGGCALGHYLPAMAITALIGTVIGAAVDPPAHEWSMLWRR